MANVNQARGAGVPTVYNPVFPDSILVVDEAVPVNIVTETDKVIAHFLDVFLCDQRLAATECPARLHHVLLRLKCGQPRVVKIIPQLDSVRVQRLVVRCEACWATLHEPVSHVKKPGIPGCISGDRKHNGLCVVEEQTKMGGHTEFVNVR